jgi:hypothetical protein
MYAALDDSYKNQNLSNNFKKQVTVLNKESFA